MAGNASDYLEVQIRKHIFRTGSFTKPTVLAVALFTAAPSDSGGGTEVSGGSYARVSLNPSDSNWTAASSTDGITTNASDVDFGVASASWGTITHWGIFDATSAGNLIVWGALGTSKTVSSGDGFKFVAGNISITID